MIYPNEPIKTADLLLLENKIAPNIPNNPDSKVTIFAEILRFMKKVPSTLANGKNNNSTFEYL